MRLALAWKESCLQTEGACGSGCEPLLWTEGKHCLSTLARRLFTVHVAAQVKLVPVLFHSEVFRNVLEIRVLSLRFGISRFEVYLLFLSSPCVFFSKEAAFENERKIVLYACQTHR